MEVEQQEDSKLTLAWRKLHLSKAKLKASSKTSALFSGFAMVAMVEAQLSADIPWPLLVAYSVCTTLLVAVHMLALMISTCILPHIEAISFSENPTAVNESPHERLHIYIETSWAFSTVFGILLFLSELAILCWVKFYEFSAEAALASTVILIPLSVVFVGFAVHFYRKLATHQYEKSEEGLRELESIMKGLQSEGDEVELERVTVTSSSKKLNGPRIMDV